MRVRQRRFDLLPVTLAAGVLLAPWIMAESLLPSSIHITAIAGWDIVLHAVALVIALQYSARNERPIGGSLAVASLLVFAVPLASTSTFASFVRGDSSIEVLVDPTAAAYVVANLVLAAGLIVSSLRQWSEVSPAGDHADQDRATPRVLRPRA